MEHFMVPGSKELLKNWRDMSKGQGKNWPNLGQLSIQISNDNNEQKWKP